MCHLMPQHLPEWQEERKQTSVHCGGWILNKGLDNTMPTTVNCIFIKYYKVMVMDDTLESSVGYSVRCNSMV